MKILYLAHRIPYPPNKGDKIRSFNEIKYLSSSHEVHLACIADNPADLRYENDLKKYCKRVCIIQLKTVWARGKSLASLIYNRPLSVGYFYFRSLQATISSWLSSNNYDVVICFSSPMAEYIFRSKVFSSRKHAASRLKPHASSLKPRLIMDFCDVDSDKWLQYSQQTRFPLSLIYRMENRLLLKYEKRINCLFDHSVFVSQQEADLFLKLCPGAKNVTAISNGVDYKYFSPNRTYSLEATHRPNRIKKYEELNELKEPGNLHQNGPILLFTGAMDYYANVDGVTWFCKQIFPMLKKVFPQAQFYIVGSNPHPKVRNLAHRSDVNVTGFVEDIRPYYQAADICVIPLLIARGVQNKVLEAMAMGKSVVTTTKSIEGIQAVPEEHVLVEDTPKDFAKAVSRLVKDQELRNRLGASARKFVMEKYDWRTNMTKFEALFPRFQ